MFFHSASLCSLQLPSPWTLPSSCFDSSYLVWGSNPQPSTPISTYFQVRPFLCNPPPPTPMTVHPPCPPLSLSCKDLLFFVLYWFRRGESTILNPRANFVNLTPKVCVRARVCVTSQAVTRASWKGLQRAAMFYSACRLDSLRLLWTKITK